MFDLFHCIVWYVYLFVFFFIKMFSNVVFISSKESQKSKKEKDGQTKKEVKGKVVTFCFFLFQDINIWVHRDVCGIYMSAVTLFWYLKPFIIYYRTDHHDYENSNNDWDFCHKGIISLIIFDIFNNFLFFVVIIWIYIHFYHFKIFIILILYLNF